MKPPTVDLRRRAERQLREQPVHTRRVTDHANAQRMLQELQIHQIELELQNEELKLTKAAVDLGLEKYPISMTLRPSVISPWALTAPSRRSISPAPASSACSVPSCWDSALAFCWIPVSAVTSAPFSS